MFFFLGVLASNWRHAVIAVVAAFIAVAIAAHVGTAGGAINTGFVGFNAVLAALGAAAVLNGDLRLAILAALLGDLVLQLHQPQRTGARTGVRIRPRRLDGDAARLAAPALRPWGAPGFSATGSQVGQRLSGL